MSERYSTVMDENEQFDSVRDEAEHRFARQLSGTGREERRSLLYWLGRSPENARAYEATERLWNELGRLRDDTGMQALRAEAEGTARRSRAEADAARIRDAKRRRRTVWLSTALAASLAALAVTTVFELYPPGFGGSDAATLATAPSERRSETLADGSTVTLNVDTRVEARLKETAREVVLAEGEAMFTVEPDPLRPFVVRVGPETRVTALGTRFQVRHRQEGAAVTLLEGSVRVDRGEVSRVLEVGQQALLTAAGGIQVETVDLEQATSWSRGWMVFRGQSLRYVVDEVNRYADHKIRIADPALADLQLSGNFYLGDSSSMVAAMSVVLPLQVEQDGGNYILHRRGG